MIDRQLRTAIAGRRLLQLTYNGKSRVVEPHDYGAKSGRDRLLVYQLRVAGQADGAKARGWRLLDVSDIRNCDVLEQTFAGSRGDSHQKHHDWDVLYARVK